MLYIGKVLSLLRQGLRVLLGLLLAETLAEVLSLLDDVVEVLPRFALFPFGHQWIVEIKMCVARLKKRHQHSV